MRIMIFFSTVVLPVLLLGGCAQQSAYELNLEESKKVNINQLGTYKPGGGIYGG
ncbi:MAG: hypothetical protein MJK10_16170 [Pseudomonadales bacterium]|nr:hypothetical protein [Pseudomonadales bacterium]NRA17668.1 hypothetical protein [Oceanospirillaceae bacterium]